MSRKMRSIRSRSAGFPPASVHAASTRSSTASSSPHGAQEVVHHRGGVGVAERRELDYPVGRTAVARPPVAAGDELRAADAQEEDRRAEALDEEGEQIERVVVGPVQVVEDEHDRPPLVGRSVGFEERLDDRAPDADAAADGPLRSP